jgi:hypothetical protein
MYHEFSSVDSMLNYICSSQIRISVIPLIHFKGEIYSY